MKLRNKKTGEIKEFDYVGGIEVTAFPETTDWQEYKSLAELNEDWEDYKEPKEYWFINDLDGKPMKCELRCCPVRDFTDWIEKRKRIGNYFETKEEAEKALEKLWAWKRLKDAGVKIVGWCYSDDVDLNGCGFNDDDFIVGLTAGECDQDDLDLLFGE